MSTVVVVHGTGVRQPHGAAMVDLVRSRLTALRPDVSVVGCSWGDRVGASLRLGGASVPDYTGTRAPTAIDSPDLFVSFDDVALWGLLYQDPLLELRIAAEGAGRPAELAPTEVPPGERLTDLLRGLGGDAEVRARVHAAGVSETFPAAFEAVVSTAVARSALDSLAAGDDASAIDLLLRAVVAEATVRLGGSATPTDGAARDELVRYTHDRLAAELGWSARSVGRTVGLVVAKLALRFGVARAIERRRGALTDAVHPAVGDVALYLTRGAPIRDLIADAIRAADGPVTVLAHSLGGVAAVDLLVTTAMPSVALLVTVGSQAPVLYETGALPSLECGEPLPIHFPPWLNIYDPRDLLAYVAGGLFPGRAVDVRVEGRQPFPRAHSAYFANPALYAELAKRVP